MKQSFQTFDTLIIGAGVFGTWIAHHRHKAGQTDSALRPGDEGNSIGS